jgi:hypothetical protein
MSKSSRNLIVLALLTVLAVPASADVFTVTLINGSSFETRYQPIQSVTDAGKLQFLTDTGNWISLKKDMVTSVTSRTESKGFGIVIDTQTIALGWDPTSIQEAADSQEAEDPTAQLLRYLVAQDQAQAPPPPPFSNPLVSEPSEVGGIPVWMTGTTTPPIGNR